MLVEMNQQSFDSLDDVSLIWACIEPTIQKIRGKNFTVKSEAYAQLTAGQRALLMFQMLYGHTFNGVEEFYSHVSYLLSKPGVWTELKAGMQHFGDYSMLQLLNEMEKVYRILEEKDLKEGAEWLNIHIDNIKQDAEILALIRKHNTLLHEILPVTIKLIGTYIRNNPDKFVHFES